LLGVLEGNNAGYRKLPRLFINGLAIPLFLDVGRHATQRDDSQFSSCVGAPTAHGGLSGKAGD
jgi:hypothetical protein